MKQLKFMLAAATAIGLAAAAQAATTQLVKTEISSESFDNPSIALTNTAAVLALDGFTFEGAEVDNDSVVVAGGANGSANALQVNTGTDPLLRKIDTDTDNAVSLDATKKVYIDTKVQFTVTPYGDTVSSNGVNDKLMIYLKEMTNLVDGVVTVTGTNLMVKAARYTVAPPPTAGDVFEEVDVKITNVSVEPNEWYRLQVDSYLLNGVAVFTIKLDDTELVAEEELYNLINTEKKVFPSLLGKTSATLDKVGFAGEGMVDDLVFSKDVEQETSVDFTFTWTETKISAVTYSIGQVTDQSVTKNEEVTGLNAGSVITLTITPADWYKLASAETITYTVPNATPAQPVSLDVYVTEAAKVEEGNKITVSETTAPSDLGIAPGSSFYADKASADAAANLSKAMTWAMKSGGATSATKAAEVVNALVFEDDTETDAEKAYLLDCTEAELSGDDGEIAKFKFVGFDLTTGFTVGKVKQVANGAAYGNGYVEVRGDTAVNGAYKEAANPTKHSFFKAFLVPFQPAAAEVE